MLETLKRVRASLTPPGSWGQMFASMNADGSVCNLRPRAVRWCLVGAVSKEEDSFAQEQEIFAFIRTIIGDEKASIIEWNDQEGRTQDEVLALLDKAIEKVQS